MSIPILGIIVFRGCRSDFSLSFFVPDAKHYGSTAVMIIGSITPPTESKWVVPQSPAILSENDEQVLMHLELSSDKWNNLDALLALYGKTDYDLLSVKISRPGMELNRSYILEQIEYFFKQTSKKNCKKRMISFVFFGLHLINLRRACRARVTVIVLCGPLSENAWLLATLRGAVIIPCQFLLLRGLAALVCLGQG